MELCRNPHENLGQVIFWANRRLNLGTGRIRFGFCRGWVGSSSRLSFGQDEFRTGAGVEANRTHALIIGPVLTGSGWVLSNYIYDTTTNIVSKEVFDKL